MPSSATHPGLSWGQTASLAVRVFKLPLYVTFDVLRSILLKPKPKPISTTAFLAAIRYINGLEYQQIQYFSGTTAGAYAAWTKRHQLPETVEGPFVDESRLYWIGPKRTDKIVLYVHGGAFFAPLQDCALSFWNHIRVELEKQGVYAGFAVLGYGLYPESTFPTQLRQLAVAFDHLLAAGVQPSNIHIVGDSAGGNIILQFLSQLLHPLDRIGPVQSIKAPLGGVYLMSPWVRFESDSLSFTSNTEDIMNQATITGWGRQYAEGVPDSRRPYVEPATAGPTWFSGLGFIVKQMLVSAGEDERFRDDIVAFAEVMRNIGGVDVQLEIQPGGVHNDAYFDFLTTDSPSQLGILTPIVMQWVKEQLSP